MDFCICFGAIVVSLVIQAQGSSSWSQFFPLMTEWSEHPLTVFKTCLYFQPFLIWYLVGILDCSLALWLYSFLPSSIWLLSVCTVLSEELDDFTGPFSLCSSTCPPHLDVSVYSCFAFFSLNIFEQILSVFLWLT